MDNHSSKLKSLQFNAIEITKNIIQRNTTNNDRARFQKN